MLEVQGRRVSAAVSEAPVHLVVTTIPRRSGATPLNSPVRAGRELGLTGMRILWQGTYSGLHGDHGHRPVLLLILTIESPAKRRDHRRRHRANHPLIEAYVESSSPAVRYRTPGFVVTAKALLDRDPDPTVEEIKEAMVGNLCRCGTYPGAIGAIQEAAAALREGVGHDR